MDNILVVDDERNIRTLCARVLAGDQIEVINKQMREGKITREQATDQIVRLLAMLA